MIFGDSMEDEVKDADDPLANLVERAAADPSIPFNEENVRSLMRLKYEDPASYEKLRIALKTVGVRVGELDKLIARSPAVANAGAAGGTQMHGENLELTEHQPAVDPVDGAELLYEILGLFQLYIVMSPGAAAAVSLWAVHSHALDAAKCAPRLLIRSPVKRCGKTHLLTILVHLVRRALPASNISPSALYRAINEANPTLIIDEADTFLKNDDAFRSVVNSGHSRALAFVVRSSGPNFKPRKFKTFASIAIAGIGSIAGTIEDRSIPIELSRRRADEQVEPFNEWTVECLANETASKIVRWVDDNFATIADSEPSIPDGLNDRAADNWRPLFAIADAAGGTWPELAREAALELSADPTAAEDSIGILLLTDIRDIFAEIGDDQLSSEQLVQRLIALEDRPWPEWGRSRKPITKTQVAKLLRPFGVLPGPIWVDFTCLRGYTLASFEESFERYCG